MKYLRKLISSMLAALLLLTIALPSDVFADATVLLYSQSFNAADQHTALKIEPESSVALKFKAQAGFKSVTVACPSWSDSEGTLKFSLYKWDTDYSETVGKNALAEKSFVNYRDNSNLTLSFSEKAAGTYLLVIENPETEDKSVGVWTLPSALSNTVFYNNGIITNAALEGSVIISGSGAGSFFGTIAEEIQSYPVKRDVVNVQPESWDGVDSLGRVLSAEGDVRSANSKKFVGLFYWTWHNNFAPSTPPRVAGEIVKKYPEAQNDFYHSAMAGHCPAERHISGESRFTVFILRLINLF